MSDAGVARWEDSSWETSDRDRLLKIVEELPSTYRIAVFQHDGQMYSVCRVRETHSIHLHFREREGESRGVVLTEVSDEGTKVSWLAGGFQAWMGALEISRDVFSTMQPA